MNKDGRPKIEIDFEMVNKLCKIQCTGEEIASMLGISYDTLALRIKTEFKMSFTEYYKKESAGGKASLRRLQWKAAENGNPTMLVWLGKQYLKQKDKHELEHTHINKYEDMTHEQLITENARLERLASGDKR